MVDSFLEEARADHREGRVRQDLDRPPAIIRRLQADNNQDGGAGRNRGRANYLEHREQKEDQKEPVADQEVV